MYEGANLIEKFINRYDMPEGKMLSASITLLIILLLTFGAVQPVINSNFETPETQRASDYLKENTDEEEMYLRQNGAYLSLSANRQSVSPGSMDYEKLRNEIREKGFGRAMRDNNVTYIVSAGSEFNPNKMSNPYTDQRNVRDIGDYRSALIKQEVGDGDNPEYFTSTDDSFANRIEKYIEFETEIQDYYFYRITETPNSSIGANE